MLEAKLRNEVIRARRVNSIGSFLVLIMFGFSVWFYEYSGIELPQGFNIVMLFIALFLGGLLFQKVNDATTAKCPRCKKNVEKGGLFGQPMPKMCEQCGLGVGGVDL